MKRNNLSLFSCLTKGVQSNRACIGSFPNVNQSGATGALISTKEYSPISDKGESTRVNFLPRPLELRSLNASFDEQSPA